MREFFYNPGLAKAFPSITQNLEAPHGWNHDWISHDTLRYVAMFMWTKKRVNNMYRTCTHYIYLI